MKNILILLFLSILFTSCATVNKVKAAKTLSEVKIQFVSASLDSLKGNPDLFEKIGTATKSILPNPQVVIIVQDLARGIINSRLATAYVAINATATLPEGADTLYVRKVSGEFSLDSLYTLPISVNDSIVLASGTQAFKIQTELPIDKRLFSIMDVNELRIKGTIAISFEPESELISFDFDEKHVVTPEEKKTFVDNARDLVLRTLVGDWVNAILPQEKLN